MAEDPTCAAGRESSDTGWLLSNAFMIFSMQGGFGKTFPSHLT